jgi:hypothetical protein
MAPGICELLNVGAITRPALDEVIVYALQSNPRPDLPCGLYKRWAAPGRPEIFVLINKGEVYVFTRDDVQTAPPDERRQLVRMIQEVDANPPEINN